MDRIQRSGLIALFILLCIAAAGFLAGSGSRTADPTSADTVALSLDPSALSGVRLLPPNQRKLLGSEEFGKDPKPHVLQEILSPSLPVALDLEEEIPASMTSLVKAPVGFLGKEVRVREGDSLGGIASKELGSVKHLEFLAKWNQIQDPNSIRIGQVIKIPPLQALEASAPAPISVTTEAIPMSSVPVGKTYTVQPGDTPSEVSMKLYGTSKKWQVLLRANGMDDPKTFRAGQVLTVPSLP
ncbi:MAG: LysM peptidoglycan-binding domain-containing protein [Planctomycetota bacterium]|nr:LysM peptidoglycan-binding domain-containing protein [Planctomycetota bacterium]